MSMYIPGQGIKKPLNQLEGPEYPLIKKALPEFVDAKKHWVVDVGTTMLHDENPFKDQSAILARPWNENEYMSGGKSSHQERISEAFRFPLTNYYEHHGPLNRLPTKIKTIHVDVNPSTISDGGTTGFVAQNSHETNYKREILDNNLFVKDLEVDRFFRIENPDDYDMVADLALKLPSMSVSAGHESQYKTIIPLGAIDQNKFKDTNHTSAGAGYSTSVYQMDTSGKDIHLDSKLTTSAGSGYTTNVNEMDTTGKDLELSSKLTTSVDAGHTTNVYEMDNSGKDIHLDSKLTTSVNAGYGNEDGYKTVIRRNDANLHRKLKENPRVSMTASTNYSYRTENDRNARKLRPTMRVNQSYDGGRNFGVLPTAGPTIVPVRLKSSILKA